MMGCIRCVCVVLMCVGFRVWKFSWLFEAGSLVGSVCIHQFLVKILCCEMIWNRLGSS